MPSKADRGGTAGTIEEAGDLAGHSDQQLIRLRLSLDRELRRRGIRHTVGDIGERLVMEHFRNTPGLPNLQLAKAGTKNVDALSREGDRYSIKTVLDAKKTGTVYPDRDDKEKQLFEFLIIAKLSEEYSLESVHQLTWALFVEMRKWDRRMSAWYVPISLRMLSRAQTILREVLPIRRGDKVDR